MAKRVKGRIVTETAARDEPFEGANRDRLEGAVDEAKGRLKGAAGELTGDERMQAEGKSDQVIGKAKQGVARAKDTANEAVRKLTDQ
jgi:uncharacterized protein YjbJ (UPF0337 family)